MFLFASVKHQHACVISSCCENSADCYLLKFSRPFLQACLQCFCYETVWKNECIVDAYIFSQGRIALTSIKLAWCILEATSYGKCVQKEKWNVFDGNSPHNKKALSSMEMTHCEPLHLITSLGSWLPTDNAFKCNGCMAKGPGGNSACCNENIISRAGS